MTKISRKITDPGARARNEARKHPVLGMEPHEVAGWVNSNVSNIADVRRVLVVILVLLLQIAKGRR